MGISKKGRRTIRIDRRLYVWSVASDDGPWPILHILSEDKRFALSCPLHTPTPYVINRGEQFQGVAKRNPVVTVRYLLPFPVPATITPQFVAALIRWATTENEPIRIEWNGTDIPV